MDCFFTKVPVNAPMAETAVETASLRTGVGLATLAVITGGVLHDISEDTYHRKVDKETLELLLRQTEAAELQAQTASSAVNSSLVSNEASTILGLKDQLVVQENKIDLLTL
jgi:hypothetical protein